MYFAQDYFSDLGEQLRQHFFVSLPMRYRMVLSSHFNVFHSKEILDFAVIYDRWARELDELQ